LRDLALLDGYSTLPVGKTSEVQDQTGGQAAGKNVAAPSSPLSALSDEGLRLVSGRGHTWWSPSNPGSASSSIGERKSGPLGPFARVQCRAASPNSVCCLIQTQVRGGMS
jgi:hypothetical protein